MDYITNQEIMGLQDIRRRIQALSVQRQLKEIRELSPYSDNITPYIHLHKEFQLYYGLHLQESNITRPAIIKDIDFDLWISSENCTNLELMQKGNSPYAFDAPLGKIELHHIGQSYDAPFAELTIEEHDVNSQLLHYSRSASWRNDEKLYNAFLAERSAYWKKRASKDYSVTDFKFDKLEEQQYQNLQEYLAEIRMTCEELYSQCPSEDLDYLSDLAKSYALMRRVGASTMSEFLQNNRDALNEDISCISCQSSDCVYCGSYQTQGEKVQRYKCKACGKVFSPSSYTLVSGTSFSFRDWLRFIDCLYNGYTLKQIASVCGITEKTALENRTKLFYALELLTAKVQLQGNVVLDETYIPVSYKGNHSNQDNFVMPRAAFKRGGENHSKGLSDNLVCVVCAIDERGNSVARVTGTGNDSAVKLKLALGNYLSEDIYCLYSDKSPAIKLFAEAQGYAIKQAKLLRKNARRNTVVEWTRESVAVNRYLQIVNSYHSRLKRYLQRFSGISTKYLSGYLNLFAWRERNKDKEPTEAYKELLSIMTAPNSYMSADDIVNMGYLPDAVKISETYRKRSHLHLERDKEIYRRYACGETMTSIAKDYGVTKQYISLVIKELRDKGIVLTVEPQSQTSNDADNQDKLTKRSREILYRNYQFYLARQKWTGPAPLFIKTVAHAHNLSPVTVKNAISTTKRLLRLREEIYIHENVTYRSTEEIYRSVFAEYLALTKAEPSLSLHACSKKLSEKCGLKPLNITRIINLMSIEELTGFFDKTHRLTSEEAYKRDKALFIDFLRWNGTRGDFCRFASEKYGLSVSYVEAILKYCLYADTERYDMV